MGEMLAMDLMRVMPKMEAHAMAEDPRATAKGLFTLACAAESFAEVVDESYEGLASALCITSRKLYDTMNRNTLGSSSRWVMEPEEVRRAYQRFENVFLCIEDISHEMFDDNWRVMIAWRNIQDQFRPLKAILVRNFRYQPEQ
jgi:hypothetical protein